MHRNLKKSETFWTLSRGPFFQRVIQWNDLSCVADVYGLIYLGLSWYVKFMIGEDKEFEQIAFQPPEKAFTTVVRILIPKGKEDFNEK